MSSDMLTEIIETLQELKRMHQLNYELLEQLNAACGYFLENHIKMPNEEKIFSLLSKAAILLREIQSESTLSVIAVTKLADEKKQRPETDDKGTEPCKLEA